MKVFKYIVLAVILSLIVVVIYLFSFVSGLKSTPEWYEAPKYYPTTLYDSIYKRTTSRLENAFGEAQPNGIFKVIVDVRTLESYMMLNLEKEMNEYGIEVPILAVVDDHLRLSTRILKGPLSGAVVYTDIFLEVTKDGKLAITHGELMAGKRKVPGFIVKQIQNALKTDISRFEFSPQDLGYKATIMKYEFDVNKDISEVVFTLKKVK